MLQEEDAKVKRAFQTLLTYVGNVARSPDEEKFRKIRLTNATFQVLPMKPSFLSSLGFSPVLLQEQTTERHVSY